MKIYIFAATIVLFGLYGLTKQYKFHKIVTMGKYIDLRCDFGFKYCLSDEIIMKSFLNAILEGDEDTITSVKFENVEKRDFYIFLKRKSTSCLHNFINSI